MSDEPYDTFCGLKFYCSSKGSVTIVFDDGVDAVNMNADMLSDFSEFIDKLWMISNRREEADTLCSAIRMASNHAHIDDRERQRLRVQSESKVIQPELSEEFLDGCQELLDALRQKQC